MSLLRETLAEEREHHVPEANTFTVRTDMLGHHRPPRQEAGPKDTQVAGFIHANGIGYFEGNVIKYMTRWRTLGGRIEELKAARHYLDALIELEGKAHEPR